ncbi:MAG: hypothetical protein HC935_02050 [Pseudanabaena sp. SU_2_4]|nr:hypothetical protein [Pseudanabaena sp. SU_2_4]
MQGSGQNDPAMRACKIFVEAVQGETKTGEKIILNQPQAIQKWDALLEGLSSKEQVPTLQAIALCLQLFAKREKGIAALIGQYMLKLCDLRAEQPAAGEAHLAILALKERDRKNWKFLPELPAHYAPTGQCPGSDSASSAALCPNHSPGRCFALLYRGCPQPRTTKPTAAVGKSHDLPQ